MAIFILNIFGGFLFIPWVIRLVWAVKTDSVDKKETQTIIINNVPSVEQ